MVVLGRERFFLFSSAIFQVPGLTGLCVLVTLTDVCLLIAGTRTLASWTCSRNSPSLDRYVRKLIQSNLDYLNLHYPKPRLSEPPLSQTLISQIGIPPRFSLN